MKKKFKINNVSLVIAIALLIVMYLFGAAKYNRFGSLSTILNLFNDNAYLIVYRPDKLPLLVCMAVMAARELARDKEGAITNHTISR